MTCTIRFFATSQSVDDLLSKCGDVRELKRECALHASWQLSDFHLLDNEWRSIEGVQDLRHVGVVNARHNEFVATSVDRGQFSIVPDWNLMEGKANDVSVEDCVSELLDNAIVAGATKVHTALRPGARDDDVEFVIADDGCGMDAEGAQKWAVLGYTTYGETAADRDPAAPSGSGGTPSGSRAAPQAGPPAIGTFLTRSIGRFGQGAGSWYRLGRRVTLRTKVKGSESENVIHLDADVLAEKRDWSGGRFEKNLDIPAEDYEKSYTVISIGRLHPPVLELLRNEAHLSSEGGAEATRAAADAATGGGVGPLLAFVLATHGMHIIGIPQPLCELYHAAMAVPQKGKGGKNGRKGSLAAPTPAPRCAGFIELRFGTLLVTPQLVEQLSPLGRLLSSASRLQSTTGEAHGREGAGQGGSYVPKPTPKAFILRYKPSGTRPARHMALYAFYFPTDCGGRETFPHTGITDSENISAAKHMWSYWNARHLSQWVFNSISNGFPPCVLKKESVEARRHLYNRLALVLIVDERALPDPNKRNLAKKEPLLEASVLTTGEGLEYWQSSSSSWVPARGCAPRPTLATLIARFVDEQNSKCDHDVLFGDTLKMVDAKEGTYAAQEVTLPIGLIVASDTTCTYISYELKGSDGKPVHWRGWVRRVFRKDSEGANKAFFDVLRDVCAHSNLESIQEAIKAGATWYPVDTISNTQIKQVSQTHDAQGEDVKQWPPNGWTVQLKQRPHRLQVVGWPEGPIRMDQSFNDLKVRPVNDQGDAAVLALASGPSMYHGVKMEVFKGGARVFEATIERPGGDGLYTFSGQVEQVAEGGAGKTYAEVIREPRFGQGEYRVRFSVAKPILLAEPALEKTLTIARGQPEELLIFFTDAAQQDPLPLGVELREPLSIVINDARRRALPPEDFAKDITFKFPLCSNKHPGDADRVAIEGVCGALKVADHDSCVVLATGLKIKPFVLPRRETVLRATAVWTCPDSGRSVCSVETAPLKVVHGPPAKLQARSTRLPREHYTVSQVLDDIEVQVLDEAGNLCQSPDVGTGFQVAFKASGLATVGAAPAQEGSLRIREGTAILSRALRVLCANTGNVSVKFTLCRSIARDGRAALEPVPGTSKPSLEYPLELPKVCFSEAAQPAAQGVAEFKVLKLTAQLRQQLRELADAEDRARLDEFIGGIPGVIERVIERQDCETETLRLLPSGRSATASNLQKEVANADDHTTKAIMLAAGGDDGDAWTVSGLVVEVVTPDENRSVLTNLSSDAEVWAYVGKDTLAKAPVQAGRATFGPITLKRGLFKGGPGERTARGKYAVPLRFAFAVPKQARQLARPASEAVVHVWPPLHWTLCRPVMDAVFAGCWIRAKFADENGKPAWYNGQLMEYDSSTGEFKLEYDDGDKLRQNLRTVPFTWLRHADGGLRWRDEISAQAGCELVLSFESLDQYLAPLAVPPVLLDQVPKITALDGEGPLTDVLYTCGKPEVSPQNPTQALIRVTIRRAGRYRVYCPYPGDNVPSEHHDAKSGEEIVRPLTWHVEVSPGTLEESVLCVNDDRSGNVSLPAREEQELELDVQLLDRFYACRNLQAGVAGALQLTHRGGPLMLKSSHAPLESAKLELKGGVASISLRAPAPWKQSLPTWPPATSTVAEYRLQGCGPLAHLSADIQIDVTSAQYVLGVAPLSLQLLQPGDAGEVLPLDARRDHTLEGALELRTVTAAEPTLRALVLVRTATRDALACGVGAVLRRAREGGGDPPAAAAPPAKKAKRSRSAAAPGRRLTGGDPAGEVVDDNVRGAPVGAPRGREAAARGKKKERSAPAITPADHDGDTGVLFEFVLEHRQWTQAGSYTLEVEAEADCSEAPPVTLSFEVTAGKAQSLVLSPAKPAQPTPRNGAISVTDFSQQFNLDAFEASFEDAWGNATTVGVPDAFQAALNARIDKGDAAESVTQLWSARWRPTAPLSVPGHATARIHDLIHQQDGIGCYLHVTLDLQPSTPGQIDLECATTTIYKAFVSNDEEKRKLEGELEELKARLQGARDAVNEAAARHRAAQQRHALSLQETQRAEAAIKDIAKELVAKGHVQRGQVQGDVASTCERCITKLKRLRDELLLPDRAFQRPPTPPLGGAALLNDMAAAWSALAHARRPHQVNEHAARPNLTEWHRFKEFKGVLGPLCMLGAVEQVAVNRALSQHVQGHMTKVVCSTQAGAAAAFKFAQTLVQGRGGGSYPIKVMNLADRDNEGALNELSKIDADARGQQLLKIEPALADQPGFLGYAVNLIHLSPAQLQLRFDMPLKNNRMLPMSLRQALWGQVFGCKLMVFDTADNGEACRLKLQNRGLRGYRYVTLDGAAYEGAGTMSVGKRRDDVDPPTMLGFPSQEESFANPADARRLEGKAEHTKWTRMVDELEELRVKWQGAHADAAGPPQGEVAATEAALRAAERLSAELTQELNPEITRRKNELFAAKRKSKASAPRDAELSDDAATPPPAAADPNRAGPSGAQKRTRGAGADPRLAKLTRR